MKRMIVFLALLPLYSYSQEFECKTKVDHKKAVVFINLNGSFLEANAAEKAACTRGESFVHIPKMTSEVKEYASLYIEKEIFLDQYKKDCADYDLNNKDCDKKQSDLDKLETKVSELRKSVPTVNENLIDGELKELANQDISITSIIMSGHNGGGTISGNLGELTKYEFMKGFDEAYLSKPKLKESLQSTLLWGCYTTTPEEVIQWKKRFPGMKIIAGFAGSGPSHIRNTGHRLMNDLLVKENSIIKEETMESAQLAIQGLDGAGATYLGLYAQCSEKQEEFYATNDKLEPKFIRFKEARDCAEKESKIRSVEIKFNEYFYGDIPLPEATSSGPLRTAYTDIRNLTHCLDPDSYMNADRAGLLLFSKGVHKNFAQTFNKAIKAYQKECTHLETLIDKKTFGEYRGIEGIKYVKQDFQIGCKKLASYSNPATLKMLTRGDINQLIHLWEGSGIINEKYDTSGSYKSVRERLPHTMAMKNLMSDYLFELSPKCMSFDLWHEYKPGTIAKPSCL